MKLLDENVFHCCLKSPHSICEGHPPRIIDFGRFGASIIYIQTLLKLISYSNWSSSTINSLQFKQWFIVYINVFDTTPWRRRMRAQVNHSRCQHGLLRPLKSVLSSGWSNIRVGWRRLINEPWRARLFLRACNRNTTSGTRIPVKFTFCTAREPEAWRHLPGRMPASADSNRS